MGRASKDKRDIYYRKAKEEGYRARSAYKLLQIHEEFNLLSEVEITTGAVDLCAAPGSWSQVLASHFQRLSSERRARLGEDGSPADAVPPRIVAVDLQEMAPIDGVTILQGDITSKATAERIVELLNTDPEDDDAHHCAARKKAKAEGARDHSPRKADIVVCDGAPDVTGMHELDEYLQHQLLLAALTITTCVLRDGGYFITKMFRGPNTPFLVAKCELFFDQVRIVKPKSSRNASMESFLIGQRFHAPPGYVPRFVNTTTTSSSSSPFLTSAALPAGKGAEERPAHDTARDPCYTPEAPVYGLSTAPGGGGGIEKRLMAFLSCGDLSGFDADMCYDREKGGQVLAPVQPPLEAPYLKKSSRADEGGEG